MAPAGPMANSGTQPGMPPARSLSPNLGAPAAVAPPPPPPSLLDDLLAEPTYLIAGGAVLALILVFGGYRIILRRRGAAADSFGAEKKTSDVGALTAGGGDTAALVAAATRAGAYQPQIAEEVDPLAEAEIYLAYGRDGQAEEILKEALQNQPRRFEIHLVTGDFRPRKTSRLTQPASCSRLPGPGRDLAAGRASRLSDRPEQSALRRR